MRYSGNGPQEEIYGGLILSTFAELFRRSTHWEAIRFRETLASFVERNINIG